MKKTVGYLSFILALLLPIQGALILFVTNKLNLSPNFSFWKEILVVILSGIFSFEIARGFWKKQINFQFKTCWPIVVYFGLVFLTLMDLIRIPLPLWLLGFRFELFWFGFFAVSTVWVSTILTKENYEYKKWLENILKWGIIAGFILSSVFSISSLIVGQPTFLGYFGYGEAASGFVSSAPSGHILDFGNNSLRLSGPFSTPNHYAGYLLLILSFLLVTLLSSKTRTKKLVHVFLIILNLVFIYLTFARFSWLAVVCILLILTWLKFKEIIIKQLNVTNKIATSAVKQKFLEYINIIILGAILIFPVFIGLIVINLDLSSYSFIPTAISKPNSTDLHRRHFLASLEVLTATPNNYLIGLGLGSSGPAAKIEYGYLNESPIVKNYYLSAQKYFITNADLVIPENWFLQVWLNGGIIYLLGYLSIFLIPILELRKSFTLNKTAWNEIIFSLGYFGIFVGCLFLHILENQTIAFMWTIIFIYWKLSVMINPDSIVEEKPSL